MTSVAMGRRSQRRVPLGDRPLGRARGWRPAIRLAMRDASRAKGRSALIAAMVGVPVALVVALSTLIHTNDVSAVEALPSTLGSADALVTPDGHAPILQSPDGQTYLPAGTSPSPAGAGAAGPWTAAAVARATGGRVTALREGEVVLRTAGGAVAAQVREIALRAPMTRGMVSLVAGRAPARAGQVAVNSALADEGFAVGSTVTMESPRRTATVVGVIRDRMNLHDPELVALPGALLSDTPVSYLVDTGRPMRWQQVRALNRRGLLVVSRSVVEHPPPASAIPPEVAPGRGDSALRAVVVIAIGSIVLEVVLLAGPAFAVGVRRQRRQHALLIATGGDSGIVRRTVLAQGLVLGAGAALAGAGLGVFGAWVGVPLAERFTTATFGPFDVRLAEVGIAVALGAAAALVAAYLPARQAARLDVVAALAGRRGAVRSRRGWPVIGAALAVAGLALVFLLGTRPGGEYAVVAGTVVIVLGMLAATPALLGVLGRAGAAAPLPIRLAARDASRQRARTAPAVAAVMAAVAGVTVLAIGSASDFAQSRRDYTPALPMGTLQVTSTGPGRQPWAALATAVHHGIPGRRVDTLRTVSSSDPTAAPGFEVLAPGCRRRDVTACQPAGPAGSLAGYANQYPSPLVADPATTADLLGRPLSARQEAVLRSGGVLVPFASAIDGTGRVRLALIGDGHAPRTFRLPAAVLGQVATRQGVATYLADAILTRHTARTLGLPTAPSSLVIPPGHGAISTAAERRLDEAVLGITPHASVYVERGFVAKYTVQFVALTLLGGLAVLIGTLTATGLALSDAQPDFATLAAVGAAPRTRRLMAMGQALVIGGTGALLGALVGFAPGIAVTWPLTAQSWTDPSGQAHGGPIIAIPWVLLAVVVLAVPLAAALLAGLSTRSRLALAARVE